MGSDSVSGDHSVVGERIGDEDIFVYAGSFAQGVQAVGGKDYRESASALRRTSAAVGHPDDLLALWRSRQGGLGSKDHERTRREHGGRLHVERGGALPSAGDPGL